MNSWLSLVGMLALTALNGALAAAENAVGELSMASLDAEEGLNERVAARLRAMIAQRPQLWITARIGAAMLIFAAAGLAATGVADAIQRAVPHRVGSVALALAALTLVHAVGARILPRATMARNTLWVASRLAFPLWLQFVALAAPTRLAIRWLAIEDPPWRQALKPEHAAVIDEVQEGSREGVIDARDVQMISNVIDLGDRLVRQVMTPRPDIVAVPVESRIDDALALASRHGRSRLPVFAGDLDHVVGILHVRDGIGAVLDPAAPRALRSLVRPPHFVPESKRVDQLLRELQAQKVHLTMVVNEFGETAGLVTIEDLLEEIVGEIHDEFDTASMPIRLLAGGAAVVDGAVSIADLNEALGLRLPCSEVDTIGGLVVQAFGRTPRPGEQVQIDGAEFEVLAAREHRVVSVRVRKTAA
ncbi:MAG: HlyC/CorC family transporter, partial [Actinobacteria bacterium]|nr:HlyC/CorC family transporter [Actinomycetota bacterium]